MRTRLSSKFVVLVSVCLLAAVSVQAAKPDMTGVFTAEYFAPDGQYYEAEVPDTLELAERGRLAVKGLIEFLDPDDNYDQYQIAFFNTNPPYMSHYNMEAGNQGKIAKGIISNRLMSGSKEILDKQAAMFQAIVRRINDQGIFYNDLNKGPWVPSITTEDQLSVNTAHVLDSFIDLYQVKPHPRLLEMIRFLADGICSLAKYEEDYAYFTQVAPEEGESHIGVLGYWQQMFYHGKSLRTLSRTYDLTGDQKYLELALKLRNLIMKSKHWQPEAAPKVVVGHEHAQFGGHHHSYTSALMGLLTLADVTGDPYLKEFVRAGYEYLRTFGIARIGLFGEMCTTGDMVWLSVKLSEMGIGDYWEDVDQYVRNHLIETQITEPERLQKVVDTMPKMTPENIYLYDIAKQGMTTDRVIERNVGCYLSDCSNPVLIRPHTFRWTICCSGNCPPPMYAAWQSSVKYDNGLATINLLLNHASPWLEMESSLPYEGKVVIRNKSAEKISVRIPRWVDEKAIQCTIPGKSPKPQRMGRYLLFNDLKAGDVLTLTFPVVETTETHTLMWKQEDMWPESTNPGNTWKPQDPPDRYTMVFRGNTLVDISPRSNAPGYQLYLRDEMKKAGPAKIVKVNRFVAPKRIHW